MRIALTVFVALTFAAPAQAATLPATFAPRVGVDADAGESVASADFNGDGRADFASAAPAAPGTVVVFVGSAPPVSYLVNPADLADAPNAVVTADVNGDGRPDLVTANTKGTVSVLPGQANGTFATARVAQLGTGFAGLDVAVGQLTADSKPDVVVATGKDAIAVLAGDGTGAFADAVYYPVDSNTRRVALGDLNGDGKTDVAATTNKVSTLLAIPGSFASHVERDAGSNPDGIAAGDLDGDGKIDLVVGNAGGFSVLPGGGTLKPYAGAAVHDVKLGDLNADGKPDIVVTRTTGLTVTLNDGRTLNLAGPAARGVVIADANADGRPDLTAANAGGLARWTNTTGRSTATAAATSDRRALSISYTAENAAKVRLYVKTPGTNAFAAAGEQTGDAFDYSANTDGAYAFYTAVVDADGNEEAAPATPDATTQVTLRRSLATESPAFGSHTVGTIFDAFAGIVNDGEATLTLRTPQLDSPDFAIVSDYCTGATLAPGDACALLVRFSPTAAGTRSARAVFADGALELSGDAVAPVVLPAPPPPPPPAAPQKIAATLGVAVRSTGKTQTRIRALVVNGVPEGATVVAKLGKQNVTKRNLTGGRLSLKVLIAKPIKVGTKLTVTITKPGMVQQVLTLTTRARKNPLVKTS